MVGLVLSTTSVYPPLPRWKSRDVCGVKANFSFLRLWAEEAEWANEKGKRGKEGKPHNTKHLLSEQFEPRDCDPPRELLPLTLHFAITGISGTLLRSRRLRRCSSWLHQAHPSALRARLAIALPVHFIPDNGLLSAIS